MKKRTNNLQHTTYNQYPLVSVIMPVYNARRFLVESLDSILTQTYRNFEVICVDDASTDNSWKILQPYAKKDKRIKIYRLSRNSGTSAATNEAIKRTKGKFICRMDADDVMIPDRIEKQVTFLQSNPDVVAVGGQCERIDEQGNTLGVKRFPLTHAQLASMVFRASPIQQPTVMINRAKLPQDFAWYDKTLKIGEDYDLYYKLLRYGKLANLSDIVLKYREHKNNLTLSSQKRSFWYISKARFLAITQHGYKPDVFSLCNVFVQTLLVLLLPDSVLYSLHMRTRELFFSVKHAYT